MTRCGVHNTGADTAPLDFRQRVRTAVAGLAERLGLLGKSAAAEGARESAHAGGVLRIKTRVRFRSLFAHKTQM